MTKQFQLPNDKDVMTVIGGTMSVAGSILSAQAAETAAEFSTVLSPAPEILPAAADNSPADPDSEVIQKLVSGDRLAFNELTRRYQSVIYGRALSMLHRHAEAQDATQDVLLRIYTHRDKFRGQSRFSTWVYRVTFNTVVMRLRALKHRGTVREPEPAAVVEPKSSGDPLRSLLASEALDIVDRVLRTMPSQMSELIYLRFIDGLSYDELSARTGSPVGTVKTRLHRARLILQEELRK